MQNAFPGGDSSFYDVVSRVLTTDSSSVFLRRLVRLELGPQCFLHGAGLLWSRSPLGTL